MVTRVRRWLHENALSLVAFGGFALFLFGQSVAGLGNFNEDQREHGRPTVGYLEYLGTSDFGESVFENWESEFLQMGAFVWLTAFLRQKGSAESKKLDGKEEVDEDPREADLSKDVPWPVRRGGVILKIYERSLGLSFLALFLASFVLHAATGVRAYNEAQIEHGGAAVSMFGYMGSSRFWFESFQNWQSEFLVIGAMIVLSIFLRHRGSPESKPVATPHHQTGG
jgi:hypothetical protein